MFSNLFAFDKGIFSELLTNFLKAVPGTIGALVVIILGLIVSKILRKVVLKFLEKIKIDKLGDKLNEIDIVDKANISIKFSKVLSTIFYYFLVLLFVVVATDILGMPSVSELVKNIFEFIPRLVVALIVLVLGILLADAIKNIVTSACKSLGIPSANLIGSLIFYFLFINIVILALSQAGIQTDFLSQNLSILIGGVAFAFAIGYGFAARSVVANFLASYYSSESINIGDKVRLEEVTGTVVDVSKSSMIIETENSRVIFPLSKITTDKIEIFK